MNSIVGALYVFAFCQSPVAALTQPPPVVVPYVINGIITSSLRVLSNIRGDSEGIGIFACARISHASCHSVSGTTFGERTLTCSSQEQRADAGKLRRGLRSRGMEMRDGLAGVWTKVVAQSWEGCQCL